MSYPPVQKFLRKSPKLNLHTVYETKYPNQQNPFNSCQNRHNLMNMNNNKFALHLNFDLM